MAPNNTYAHECKRLSQPYAALSTGESGSDRDVRDKTPRRTRTTSRNQMAYKEAIAAQAAQIAKMEQQIAQLLQWVPVGGSNSSGAMGDGEIVVAAQEQTKSASSSTHKETVLREAAAQIIAQGAAVAQATVHTQEKEAAVEQKRLQLLQV